MVKQWDSIWCYFSITSNAVIDDPIEKLVYAFPQLSKLEFEAGQVTISRTRNLQYAILKPLKIQQQEGITRIRIFKSRVLNGNDCSWKRIRVAGQGALVMSAADGPKTLLSHSSWWWFSEGISKSSYFHLCSCRQTVAEIPPNCRKHQMNLVVSDDCTVGKIINFSDMKKYCCPHWDSNLEPLVSYCMK